MKISINLVRERWYYSVILDKLIYAQQNKHDTSAHFAAIFNRMKTKISDF